MDLKTVPKTVPMIPTKTKADQTTMAIDARHLLKRLEPVVRPTGLRHAEGYSPLEHAEFDDLLARAARGELASGRNIDTSNLVEDFPPELLDRMGRVADAAEAAGFRKILMVAEDRPVLLDVPARVLERELGHTDDEQLHRVDAAVRLLAEEEKNRNAPGPEGPRDTKAPPAIAEAILNKTQTSHGDRDEAA